MPNWCQNNINIRGDKDSDIKTILEFFDNSNAKTDVMNSLVPYLDYDLDKLDPRFHHSAFTHYTKLYGTKWDFLLEECDYITHHVESSMSLYSSAAWSPPIGFCKLLSEKYKVEVDITYFESGSDIAGTYSFVKGNLISSQETNYQHGLYLWDNDYFFERFEDVYAEEYLEEGDTPGNNKYSFKEFLNDYYPFLSDDEKDEYNNKFYKK